MSRPWHEGRLLAFDCETTGVDVESDRIVQAAMIEVGGGQPPDSDVLLIDPGVEIPEGATAVHGITTERARAEGQAAAPAVQDIASTLTLAIRSRVPIVGMNLRFDLTLADREARRYGLEPPPWDDALVVDVLVIDKFLDRYRRGSRRLATLCEHYGVELTDAHDAGADALAAARVAWVQATRAEYVPRREEDVSAPALWYGVRHDIIALHDAQTVWAREQSISLRQHFIRKGDHAAAASVSEHWPVTPRA